MERVGGCTTLAESLKATTPSRMFDGWSATNFRAACFAAAIRVGARSLAFMLDDTSNASTTVPWRRGRSMRGLGRARADEQHHDPEQEHAPAPRAAATPAADPSASRPRPSCRAPPRRCARRRTNHTYPTTSTGTSSSASSAPGSRNVTGASLLAHGDHAEEHAHEVVVGGEVVVVHAGAADRGAQLLVARRDRLAEPAAEPGIAGVDDELLAGLGVLQHDDTGVDQPDLPAVPDADRDDLVSLREHPEHPLPSRLADEVGQHEHQRAPADGVEPGAEQPAEVGGRVPCAVRRAQQVTREPEHLHAATARLDDALDRCCRRAPRRCGSRRA